jgi:hypothetical protein
MQTFIRVFRKVVLQILVCLARALLEESGKEKKKVSIQEEHGRIAVNALIKEIYDFFYQVCTIIVQCSNFSSLISIGGNFLKFPYEPSLI